MPVTTAPAAVPESPVTLLLKKFWFSPSEKIPVMLLPLVIFDIVFPLTLLPANVLSLNPTQRTAAMAALPPVILLKVLLVTVFLDPGVVPSALLQPLNVPVVPVRVMLEKLLPVFVSVTVPSEVLKAL